MFDLCRYYAMDVSSGYTKSGWCVGRQRFGFSTPKSVPRLRASVSGSVSPTEHLGRVGFRVYQSRHRLENVQIVIDVSSGLKKSNGDPHFLCPPDIDYLYFDIFCKHWQERKAGR